MSQTPVPSRSYRKREMGRPCRSGFAESFLSQLRDEPLKFEEFESLAEARWFAARRLNEHNEERP